MTIKTIGLNLAKQIFQIHGLGEYGHVVLRIADVQRQVGSLFCQSPTPPSCRIPDDYLSKRLWKLTLAREGLGKLLETLKARTT
jgi:hypothetical protein